MIYVYIGAPGQGKTFSATHRALSELKKGRTVFSNFPIEDTKRHLVTKIWKKEYASTKHIKDSLIIIDEAYKDWNSKDWKDITPEEHSFFAECRHWGNDIILIAQSSARVATIAKEIANIVIVKKYTILYWWIIGFKLEYYETVDDISRRHISKDPLYYRHDFIWFNKRTAKAYDTHYNSRQNDEIFKGEPWNPDISKESIKTNLKDIIPSIQQKLSNEYEKVIATYFNINDLKHDINWGIRQIKQIRKRLIWEVNHRKKHPFFMKG